MGLMREFVALPLPALLADSQASVRGCASEAARPYLEQAAAARHWPAYSRARATVAASPATILSRAKSARRAVKAIHRSRLPSFKRCSIRSSPKRPAVLPLFPAYGCRAS